MGTRDPRVDACIADAQPFARPILTFIRKAVHAGCPDVEETLKWGRPAFMYKGILCGMAAFKEHVVFGFWNGAAMDGLGNAGGDATRRFERITSIDALPTAKTFVGLVRRAAALQDRGVKAPRMKRAPKAPLTEPDDLLAALKKNRKARTAYDAFSPSHKREYVEWITEAKTSATRKRRLDTAIEWMAEGKPRNWKYM
jgi:uncharacterized protein YdeI (YjbR/CyaY-like superfamily)